MPLQIEKIVNDYGFWKMIVEGKGAVEIRTPLDDDLDRMTEPHETLSLVAVSEDDTILGLWFQDYDEDRPWMNLGEGHIFHPEP